MAKHSVRVCGAKQAFLLEFPQNSAFARIGISFSQSTGIDLAGPGSEIVLKVVMDELLSTHADVFRYCPMPRTALVFEHSPLHDRLKKLCQGLTLEGGGSSVPIRFTHLPKDQIGPGGEIADCIAHTVCAVMRTNEPEAFLMDRYNAIFKPLNNVPAHHRQLSGEFQIDVRIRDNTDR